MLDDLEISLKQLDPDHPRPQEDSPALRRNDADADVDLQEIATPQRLLATLKRPATKRSESEDKAKKKRVEF